MGVCIAAHNLCHLSVILIAAAYAGAQTTVPKDVTVSVTIWPYSRIYPLLDGLFQDVASTQVKSLLLDPNSANATNLDALQQAFQLQVQYSATAGVQNSLAAQQANSTSASTLLQAQLISKQSQLVQSQLLAQNQVGIAQKTVDTLVANGATQADISTAKLQLQLGTDNLNSVTSQLADVKGQLSTVATPSFTPPAASLPASIPTLPSSLAGPANVPSSFSPNLPGTKQLDNQMTVLWERLSRLVYTMNQTASQGTYYLLQINTGIVPIQRKHQLLSTHFQLSCGRVVDIYPRASNINIINEKYRETRFGLGALLQFFSVGLNASYNRDHLRVTQLLSPSSYITGFGIGKEHFGWIYGITMGEDSISPGVRDTFALVQLEAGCTAPLLSLVSATWDKTIPRTNFGSSAETDPVEPSNDFSPTGRFRADGIIQTAHDRKVVQHTSLDMRLINGGAVIAPDTAPGSTVARQGDSQRNGPDGEISWTVQESSEQITAQSSVESVSYTPVEDDVTSPLPSAVMVTVGLADATPIDPEATITADGILVSRIRDTFGRAVSGGGSGGILESSTGQLQLNTWIPVNSHSLILNLNPRTFRGHFPAVLLQSPRGVMDLSSKVSNVYIQGRSCDQCTANLPALSYPKVPVAPLSVARWMFWSADPAKQGTGDVQYNNKDAKIVINVVGGRNLASPQGSVANTPLQVIDDVASNPWGAAPQVQLVMQPDNGTVYRLQCSPVGPQLVCSSPAMIKSSDASKCSTAVCLYTDANYLVDVVDAEHSGGPFHGRGTLAACGEAIGRLCSQPLIWAMDLPVWTTSTSTFLPDSQALAARPQDDTGWIFHLSMINVSSGERVQLNKERPCSDGRVSNACSDLNQRLTCQGNGKICDVYFALRSKDFAKYQDRMQLQVYPERPPQRGATVAPIAIGGLKSQIAPILTSVSADSTQLSGSNLVFDQLAVGADPNQKIIQMTCSPPTDCTVSYPSGMKKGYLYFVVKPGQGESGLVPVILQGAQGISKVMYSPPEKATAKPSVVTTQQVAHPKVPLSSATAE
jgi:hypothetical protein